MTALLTTARARFHASLVKDLTLMIDSRGVASNADGSQVTSKDIALHIAKELGAKTYDVKLAGQKSGRQFEADVCEFIKATFPQFTTLRPGNWIIENVGGSRAEYQLAHFEPYTHLDDLARAIEKSPTLSAVLGNSYDISPDIFITRKPEPDSSINTRNRELVDAESGKYGVIRWANQHQPIVHAVVSCKWTLRSDRAQNARSEALNIIKNRKGQTPHIMVVTGEPSPSRLASLALGTGDIDMVYHFALPELVEGVRLTGNDEAIMMLKNLISGKRLRDITDLPLDLAI
ncbi:NgoMIV family type II restriction endonuclease [Corynebacterium sp. CCM 8835]|uniref:Restriction endonuclease n=1 Tax=Corynebacterium antarcticum TaxID=2800405 RepID=A0ABS1FIC4_9CORY|nr:NgoMIV family type II restriction endonuclease [Corynebacterium antarcticum]MCL0245950.1 NgoMIV family type II restriction endonuclease [Corynebacterium antarcticum]